MHIQTAPYLMKKESKDGKELTGNDRFEGYCADLAEQIARSIKFKYKIETVKDGAYGRADENGTWNGMVGELIDDVSDSGR